MGRRHNHRSGWGRPLVSLATLALLGTGAWLLAPHSQWLLERAALVSAAATMPDGLWDRLAQRFAGQLEEDSPANDLSLPPPSSSSQPEPDAASQPEEASLPEPEEEDSPFAALPPLPRQEAPEIPPEYQAPLREVQMVGDDSGTFLPVGAGYLRNYTTLSFEEIAACIVPPEVTLPQTDEPLVLILHTHATESFEPADADVYDTRSGWRDTDNTNNMVRVGAELAATLEAEGIGVIHDTTQHDYPSYNGSYDRSAQTIARVLEEYPSIQVILDVHRDGIQQADGTVLKPVAEIDGKKAAQLMIISGCDDGTVGLPNWEQNLQFAAAITDQVEQDYPGLMRPIFFAYRKYNMDVTPCSLLLEFGSNGNTLEEACTTARLVGSSIAKVIRSMQE